MHSSENLTTPKPKVVCTWTQIVSNLVNFHLRSPQKSIRILGNCTRLCETRFPVLLDLSHRTVLPVLPELNDSDEFYPLLVNLPHDQLSDKERLLRKNHLYQGHIVDISLSADDAVLDHEIQNLFNFYAQKWNIEQDVLIVNLNRLLTLLCQLTLSDFILKHEQKLYKLSVEEWFIGLEFYLQMDVQCFFMKTCSFRQSIPRCIQEGLFSLTLPESQYGMKQCRDQSCRFCYERLDLTDRFERAMSFSNQQIHHFINHYQVYLNCDVTCTTSNVIYALTCPCRQYDYIGRCGVTFRDRMWQHRTNGCRIMSNFFLGPTVTDRLQYERKEYLQISASHIKLYQHSTECPIALQLFLGSHPNYWCFVPMPVEHALLDDRNMTPMERDRFNKYDQCHSSHTSEEMKSDFIREATLVRWCVENVPSAPPNYQFSLRQRMEQFDFFQHRLDLHPSRFLDLYNAAIVIALPENSSDELRHLIQALLVAYAEPKLNVTILSSPDCRFKSNPNDTCWCQQLVHPHLRPQIRI